MLDFKLISEYDIFVRRQGMWEVFAYAILFNQPQHDIFVAKWPTDRVSSLFGKR